MNVIADTTVISNFAAVGRLDLLRKLLGEVYLSIEVYAEIQDGLAEGNDFYAGIETHVHPLTPNGWLRLTSLEGDEELLVFGQLTESLHRGEAASLAIATQRSWAFFTDDVRARKIGRDLKVTISGTLGVLIQAVKRHLLSLGEANALLVQMMHAGYYAPAADLAEFI